MVLQEKTVGSQVPFDEGVPLDQLKYYLFRDDVFGVLTTQPTPVTVSADIRNAFMNGALTDIQTQALGQGMQIDYMRITWNETSASGGYYITDLVIGMVAKVMRDYNTGPAYLMDAARAISWFQNFTNKVIGIPNFAAYSKAYRIVSHRHETHYHRWSVGVVSNDWIGVAKPIGEPLPDLPDPNTLKPMLSANIDKALGEATRQLLGKGFAVTYPWTDGYGVDICFEKTPTMRQPGGYMWGYQYKVHARLWFEFTTDPEFTVIDDENNAPLGPWIIIAAVVLILLAIGGAYRIATFGQETTENLEFDWVKNADGSVWINPATGQPQIYLKSKGSTSKTSDWLTFIVPVALLIVGGIIVYGLIQRVGKGKKEIPRDKQGRILW